MKSGKPPAPKLVIHPSWGYACLCPVCGERLQNDRDMRTSEKMYERHWRDKHKGKP